MLGKIKTNKKKAEWESKLKNLRGKIDKVDKTIIKELHKRWVIAEKIKYLKKRHDLKIVDDKRMKQMKKKHLSVAKKYNVPGKVVSDVFRVIVNDAIRFMKMKNDGKKKKK